MRLSLIAILVPLAVCGCVERRTIDTSAPAPAPTQTLIVPPAAAPAPVVICSNGASPPCP